jgi:DnaJ-class molecular chaperone
MGGGKRGGGEQKRRVKPLGKILEVTLEDLFNGKEEEFEVERQRICVKCNGLGGTDAKAVVTCKGCKGKGMRTVMMQLGPGMYSQRSGPCDECNGQGESIDPKKKCTVCLGKKVKVEKKLLKVEIDKGAPDKE